MNTEPTLNRSRLAIALGILSVPCAVPFFMYLVEVLPMPTAADVVISLLMALYAGTGTAGAIICMIAFFMKGTLPRWFWS